ncbi:hypothetical protein TL16_g11200 [Triparma laevis f. inornata]|uniref:glucan 1,3-beta-glucosidase n=1 Tax=Triparma laevis f. inornata TaxID=1714386 RepID=A0A9W7BCQ6_9STRA|nr:hypothetical protein TL16_g11200 [Triparma laevis f. inornata]
MKAQMQLAKALTLLSLLAISASALPQDAQDALSHVGVNLGGWYLIEEWMFSNGQFDRVVEMSDLPQGVVMPPLLPDGMGENWYGEGDLINKIATKYSDDFAVQVIEAHRQAYVTDEDIASMKSANITNVRMPLGWWAFVEESTKSESTLITDPAHSDMRFVTITHDALIGEIQRFKDAGLNVLLDIHAMPGGSSEGSYSGIFPSTPMFWDDASLMKLGNSIIETLCNFYLNLDDELRDSITGITLLNEPAHNMDIDTYKPIMTNWLAGAIDIYRKKVVEGGKDGLESVPKLFVNLIGTAMSDQDMLDFFHATFTPSELENWAVLDIHHYFAWDGGHNGCYEEDSCSFQCSDSATKEGLDNIKGIVRDGAESSHSFFFDNGTIPLVSCSEYSLATYDTSEAACRGQSILDAMFLGQKKSFKDQGLFGAFFWTWKMPYGGAHENAWSLKKFLGLGS